MYRKMGPDPLLSGKKNPQKFHQKVLEFDFVLLFDCNGCFNPIIACEIKRRKFEESRIELGDFTCHVL